MLRPTHAGTAANVNGAWRARSVDMSGYAGQTVRLLFEAADGGINNVVEAGIDDVRVFAVEPGGGLGRTSPRVHLHVVAPGLYAA